MTFALVCGVLLGVFAAMLTAPKRQETIVVRGAEDAFGGDRSAPSGGSDAPRGAGLETVPGDRDDQQGPATTLSGAAQMSGDAPGNPGAPSAQTPGGRSTATGVRTDTVRIGVAYPDTSATRQVSSTLDNGNVPQQYEALLDRWKRDKLLPIHGRQVTFVYRAYNALTAADQRATCVSMAQDHKVFLVVAPTVFEVGGECLAREFKTLVLQGDGPPEDTLARTRPLYFSLGMSVDRMQRNWVHWAHQRRLLQGKKIGLYYESAQQDVVNKTIKVELGRLGYKLTEEISTDSANGGPQDSVAVQRFRTAGVDLVMFVASPFVKANFMRQADAQRYKPTYIENDFGFGSSDQFTPLYPPEQFAGTYAMTGRRIAEQAAGMPLPAESDSCLRNYERFAGRKVKPERESGEWSWVLYSCDMGKVILAALQAAGTDLTSETFAAGMETIRDMPLNRWAHVTYTPTKHHGGERQRTQRWHLDCRCWKAEGTFEPLFVP